MKKLSAILLVLLIGLGFSACGKEEKLESIKEFPEIQGVDFEGNEVDNSIFEEYDLTIVNFWSNT